LDDQLPDGKLVLTDAHNQIQWNNNNKNWGKKYKNAADTFRQQLKEELKRYAIPVQFYNTTEPIESQVRRDVNRLKAPR
jgi:transposase-like protein